MYIITSTLEILRPPLQMTKLSFIIPALNEAYYLTRQRKFLRLLIDSGHEVMIIDGGSKDNSIKIAESLGCRTYTTKPSRGYQLHFGALKSTNNIIVFLHADTCLPSDATGLIIKSLAQTNSKWGYFNIGFTNRNLIFKVIAWFMNKRTRFTGIVTGDHTLFVERNIYLDSGGFSDIPIMEDIDISKRLNYFSSPTCIASNAITSSRKWETHGIISTILKMWLLRILFFFGISPHKISKMY